MKRHVLHVSESDEWSGGTAQLLALAEGLRRRGWGNWIACRPQSGLWRHALARNFAAVPVALREDYDLLSAWQLSRFIRRENIHVLHAHHNRSHSVCLLAKAILKFSGAPAPALVVSRRVSFPPGKNPFSRWKYRSGLIDSIVAVADAVKEVLVSSGVPPSRVRVIRSGVDERLFAPAAANPRLSQELGLPAGIPVIGKIANASPWKGQTVLLEAAAILARRDQSFHVLFAGRDTNGEWMRSEVRNRGLESRVSLIGFRTDIPDLIRCLDLSVNAAIRGEGLSGALRESLACGIPVIASDLAGNRELLGPEGKEWLFQPGHAESLAERLSEALARLPRAKSWALRWRDEKIKDFGLERALDETIALYLQILEK